jgi:hypothetical protein
MNAAAGAGGRTQLNARQFRPLPDFGGGAEAETAAPAPISPVLRQRGELTDQAVDACRRVRPGGALFAQAAPFQDRGET